MSSLKDNYHKVTLDQRKDVFIRPFTIDGIRTSNDNMNVNGSITPVEFWTAFHLIK